MSARILVCDDDSTFLQLLLHSLAMDDLQVITAENGEEALHIIHGESPDLVILDVLMPKIDGFEVCRKIREQPHTALIPVIILSNLSDVEDKVLGLHAGADHYVTKPVDYRELSARISSLLERSKILRDSARKLNGKLLAFMGAKGGVGTTSTAVNMAALLAARHNSVIVAEARPDLGTLAAQLGKRPENNLSGLVVSRDTVITQSLVASHLVSISSRMQVLFGPQKPGEFGEIDVATTTSVVNHLISMADYVLIDLPHAPTAATEAVINSSTVVFLMIEPEAAAVSAAAIQLQQLDCWGLDRKNIKLVVVNRQGRLWLSLREIENRLDHPLAGVIPCAMESLSVAIQYGLPLVQYQPEHAMALTLTEVLEQVLRSPSSTGRSQQ